MIYHRTHAKKTRGVRAGRPINTPDAPNRYIRCQSCGFPCDTTRDVLMPISGNAIESYGVAYTRTTDMGERTTTTNHRRDIVLFINPSTSTTNLDFNDYIRTVENEKERITTKGGIRTTFHTAINYSYTSNIHSYPSPTNPYLRITDDDEKRVTAEGLDRVIQHIYTDFPYPYSPTYIYQHNIHITHNCPACGAQYTTIPGDT